MLTSHIAEHDLEAYSLDRMDVAASEAAEEHLLVCDYCRERLAEWDEYCRAIRAAGRMVKPPGAARQAVPRSERASS